MSAAVVCPWWCREHAASDDGTIVHRRSVGSVGVAVEQSPSDPAPVVYVPDTDLGDDYSASPAFARQLGRDLIAAAEVIDRD